VAFTDFGEIEVFLTLAEELHFGRTADRLDLSRARVSQLVQSLERRVGGRLFDRTSRRVELTPLGDLLRAQAHPAFTALQLAVQEAKAVARGLRIGFLGGLSGSVDALVAAFQQNHPMCPVTMTETVWTDFYGPLRRSEVDVQITLGPVREPDLTVGPVLESHPRLLAVRSTHPLAGRSEVSVDDLAGETMVSPPSNAPMAILDGYLPFATSDGRPINRGHVAQTQQEAFNIVAQTGEVCTTSTATVRYFQHPDLVFIPIPDLPAAQAVLVWRTATENSKIRDFVRAARP
jgi:DNA-binding transcriptional LysR family regulator